MTEDTDDLDRHLARLFEEGYRREDPEDHPSPEKLSAYQANELPPEEADDIQEHVTRCGVCTGLLLDLQRFLEPREEDRPREGVADIGAEAGWRALRAAQPFPTKPLSQPFFTSTKGGYSVAAALLAVAVGLAVWNANLVRESHEPRPIPLVRTFEAQGSLRAGGRPSEPPVVLPVPIILSLSTDTPERAYRVDFIREGQSDPEQSLEVPAQGTELSILLPERALRPARYTVRVVGLREGLPSPPVWTYELTVGSPAP